MRRLQVLLLLAAPAVLADGADPVAANERGLARLLEGRPREAVEAFEEALAARPGSRVLRRNLAAGLAAVAETLRAERGTDEAIHLLRRAVELHPERLRYRVLLGRARVESDVDELRASARDDFAHVLARDPEHLEALVNLGHIAYLERDLEEAVRCWSRALELRPGDADIEDRLEKARRERDVEEAFEELEDVHFLVRHGPSLPLAKAQEVLALCQQARGELTALYQSYPPRIVVTLYSPAQFRAATRLHGWVAGLSDGTIRLAVRAETPLASLRATVYHELTHHVVRKIAPEAPAWLHEGLAQIEEGKSAAQAEARLRRAEGLSADVLSADVLRQADPRQVSLFYDVALAFTRHLHDTRSGALLDLLRALGEGRSERDAIRTVFGASRDDLFAAWRTRMQGR